MKKNAKIRLTLNRETLRSLEQETLRAAQGGIVRTDTCTCLTNTCPTRCGQWYC